MAGKVLIDYVNNLGELKAQLGDVIQANQAIGDSAKQTAQQVGDEYRKVASTAAKAFAGQEVSKALQDQEKNVDALTQSLTDLYNEELRLLQGNKQLTDEFKKNRATFEQTRKEFDAIKGTAKALSQEVPKTAAEISKLEDRLRELAIAGQQGTQEFDDIARAIGEYKAAITTADRAVDLYAKSTDAATGRLGELEDKLYDLALAGQTNTQEFKDTIAQVTKLKRAVFEVDQQVDSYVERSRGFATVVQNVELIGNAFQLVEGAAALFGEENEELQKTLVRLNAILAITQGLEQARTILLEQSAKQTGLAAVAQRGYALAVGQSTGLLKAFRIALAASGVGLLVVGLGLLIEKIISAGSETSRYTKIIEQNNEALSNADKSVNSFSKRIEEARLRIKVANGEITQSQADLQKSLKDIEDEAFKAYAPLVKESNTLNNNLKLVNDELAKQERLTKRTAIGAAEKAENEQAQARILILEQRRNELIQEISKNEESRNEVISNAKELADILTEAKKAEDNANKDSTKSSQENTKAVEEQAKAYEQLAVAASDVTSKLIASDKAIQEATTNILIQTREKQLSQLRVLAEQGLATREQIAEAEIKLILANERAQREAVENSLKESLEGVKAGSLEEVKVKQSAKAEIENIEQQSAEAIFNINKGLSDNIKSDGEKLKEERERDFEGLTKAIFQYVNAIGSAFASIVDLQNELSERRIEQIERFKDAELKANGELQQSNAQRVRNQEAIELRAARKIAEEKRKQARLDKALAIFNTVANTAESIVKTGAELGYPQAIPFQVIAGIIGGIQLDKISSEPLPSFGKGGWIDGEPHTRGGVDINAEGGEFVTRKSQAGTFRRELEAMNTSRAAFLKVIEEGYVRPRLAQLSNDRSVNVNVNARLNSDRMEGELIGLRKETRRTGRIIQKAMAHSHSQRYSW